MGHQPTVLSTFCGAGGMDLGFREAGFEIVHASDHDPLACETYRENIGDHVHCCDVQELTAASVPTADVLVGGPPCQGFSVAGHMRPDDPRSQLVWEFVRLVSEIRPRAFVMENVKALAKLTRFRAVRQKLLRRFHALGYETHMLVLNACEFGVPQMRERAFFIGVEAGIDPVTRVPPTVSKAVTVREVIGHLPEPGIAPNLGVCRAKVVLADYPVLRRSPYAGMLFNGQGRPILLDGAVNTLPASMGGNRTPIIDELELRERKSPWIKGYHAKVWKGGKPGGAAPKHLRRITVTEASLLQTFPLGYQFAGKQSAQYRQVGNAVPPKLAHGVASTLKAHLEGSPQPVIESRQLALF